MAALPSTTIQPLAVSDFSGTPKLPRRQFFLGGAYSLTFLNLNCNYSIAAAKTEDDEGILGALQSLLDPNEKTKSGKVLPKDYLNSARTVVKTLRESLNEDSKNTAKFYRTADAAKQSIKEYLSVWRGQKSVVNEESYVMIEKVIRSLAGFYSKAGPSASMPEKIKSEILSDLVDAEKFL